MLFEASDQFLTAPYQDRDAKRLIERLTRHRNELFPFFEYPGVSPYNHDAEQQIQNLVLTRKVSQQNRSKHGAKTQAILMTLFRFQVSREMLKRGIRRILYFFEKKRLYFEPACGSDVRSNSGEPTGKAGRVNDLGLRFFIHDNGFVVSCLPGRAQTFQAVTFSSARTHLSVTGPPTVSISKR